MRFDHTLRLNELLLEREAQFVRVYDLEQAAAKLLGEPYPFSKPVLPSDGKGKRKVAVPRSGLVAGSRDRLRRLEDGEVAYRVTYRQFDQIVSEEHDELDAIRTLFASQGAQLQVVRVETLDAVGAVRTVIFSSGVGVEAENAGS